MSILSRLKKLRGGVSFHTPGHKGALCRTDLTELEEVFPDNCIEEAQNDAAQHYGAKHVRFLVNGSSIGVKSMIYAVGGNILVPENRHRAVDEGAELAGVKIKFIRNEFKYGLPMPITAEQIKDAYNKDENIRAVIVISPDYYGFTADLKSIRAVCDELGIYMLVDAAHGAHFATCDNGENKLFPLSASRIADACNMSAHKTMRAFTQTAYLAVNNGDLLPKADHALALLGTTSPSYPFLAQLEQAIVYEETHAGRYERLIAEINRINGKAFKRVKNDDPMRLVLDFSPSGMTGREACEKLEKCGIYAEMSCDDKVVFIITLSDSASKIRKLGRELARL